jgi:hypothetical protein
MSKTPFEIRLEVLQMAKDYLDGIYSANLKIASEMIASSNEMQSYTAKQLEENIKKFTPAGYSSDDLIKKANEFYSFVCSKA